MKKQTGWRRFFRKAGAYWATASEVLARADKIAVRVDAVLRECQKVVDEVKQFRTRWADGFGPSPA
ncbi:hypothetical protein [Kitasatospora sp. NPDC088783]|uniref:hypothetical protein n=1 Tax=Kitasatospora sp. NPDC088783 TaxID=3364077 RepID=UPI0037F43CE4